MTDRVSITVADHVADVRLTRADKMNALDPAMFEGIAGAIERLRDMADVRAVVLSGEGRGFCAGLDMASMAGGGTMLDIAERDGDGAVMVQRVAIGWRSLPMPVIAAAHGVALGGGFQVYSGADIRVAHSMTRMSIMEARWGLVPDMGGWALWRGSVRDDVLRELAYTAREFTAVEAKAFGFVTHLDDDPLARAHVIAHEIATRSPAAVRGIKRLANAAYLMPVPELLALETEEQLRVIRTPDQIEAVAANMAHRKPVFAG